MPQMLVPQMLVCVWITCDGCVCHCINVRQSACAPHQNTSSCHQNNLRAAPRAPGRKYRKLHQVKGVNLCRMEREFWKMIMGHELDGSKRLRAQGQCTARHVELCKVLHATVMTAIVVAVSSTDTWRARLRTRANQSHRHHSRHTRAPAPRYLGR